MDNLGRLQQQRLRKVKLLPVSYFNRREIRLHFRTRQIQSASELHQTSCQGGSSRWKYFDSTRQKNVFFQRTKRLLDLLSKYMNTSITKTTLTRCYGNLFESIYNADDNSCTWRILADVVYAMKMTNFCLQLLRSIQPTIRGLNKPAGNPKQSLHYYYYFSTAFKA